MSKKNPLRAIYEEHIELQKTSKLSLKEYCRQNNLVEHKLSYYRNYKTVKKKESLPERTSKFSQLKLKSPKLEDKLSLTPKGIDPVWLARFLNELRF